MVQSILAIKLLQFDNSQLVCTVCSIWLIDKTPSDVTTPGQSGPGSNDNEGALRIPQISKAGALPSDCLMSYPGYSSARALPLYKDAVGVFYRLGRLGQNESRSIWKKIINVDLILIGQQFFFIYFILFMYLFIWWNTRLRK